MDSFGGQWVSGNGRVRRLRVAGVYFVECCDFVKIGHTGCMVERLESLQIGAPFTMRCLALIGTVDAAEARRIEHQHHKRFEAFRYRGEWFRNEGELAAYIATLPNVNLYQ